MSEFFPLRPAARIQKGAGDAQNNLGNGVAVVTTFSDVSFESHVGMADVANNQIVIPVPGIYLLQASTHWDATVNTSGTYRFHYFTKNGGVINGHRALMRPTGAATVASRYTISALVDLAKDDAIRLISQADSGGTADLQGVSNFYMSAVFMDRIR